MAVGSKETSERKTIRVVAVGGNPSDTNAAGYSHTVASQRQTDESMACRAVKSVSAVRPSRAAPPQKTVTMPGIQTKLVSPLVWASGHFETVTQPRRKVVATATGGPTPANSRIPFPGFLCHLPVGSVLVMFPGVVVAAMALTLPTSRLAADEDVWGL